MTWADEDLRQSFPAVEWDAPAVISVWGERPRNVFACRYCIARFGIKGADIADEDEGLAAWEKADDFIEHLAIEHGR